MTDEGRVLRFASDFTADCPRFERADDPQHSEWANSAVDESLRLQIVREEIWDEAGGGETDEFWPQEPRSVIKKDSVVSAVTPGYNEGPSSRPTGRRRTLSTEAAKQPLSAKQVAALRDSILENVATSESRAKAHILSFSTRIASIFGLKNRIIRKSAFYPPDPPSYSFLLKDDGDTNALVRPPTSSDKILVQECYVFLKSNKAAAALPKAGIPRDLITRLSGNYNNNRAQAGDEEAGSVLQCLPASKLRVSAFKLRRISDGDYLTAAILLYKPILKSEALCAEDREDMLTDLQLRPLIIFSHGNSTDVGFELFSLAQLATRLHVNVLSYDYPQYGLSRGKLSEKSLHTAFKVTYDFARQRLRVPRTMILLYGQSVGSVPTCYAAGLPDIFPCCGVILHSPLASAFRIIVNSPRETVSRSDIFDNNTHIKQCPWPILIMHGIRDFDVPVWHGCLLDKSARTHSSATPATRAIFNELVMPHLAELFIDTAWSSPEIEDTEKACWESRVRLWLPEFAAHNNIEILYKAEYFMRLRDFIAGHVGRISFKKKI